MIQMIIHYEIEQSLISQYWEAIDKISAMLPEFEAKRFACSKNNQQNTFTETFFVPTESHYHALKKLRLSRSHSVFGRLEDFVTGGLDSMEFIAIKQKR